MNISELNTQKSADATCRVELLNPLDGTPLEHDGKPMYAIVTSKNSKAYEAALSRIVNAAKKAEKFGEQDFSYSAEKIKKANLVAACTRHLVFFENDNWVDIKNDEGQDAQHKAVRDAYLAYDWMLDQADLEIGKQSNFLGKSAPSSLSI